MQVPNLSNVATFLLEFGVVTYEEATYILGGIDAAQNIRMNTYCVSVANGIEELPDMPTPKYRFATANTFDGFYTIGGLIETGMTATVEFFSLKRNH